MRLEVRLLGGFGVTAADGPVPDDGWRLRKAKALVKLLALAPGHRLHREQVMGVLWPDRDHAAAANNLHQVVHAARRQLGRDSVRLDDDVLGLRAVSVDALAFRDAAAAALREGDAQRAETALALYRGPLLPEDLYEDWTEPLRSELEHLRAALAELAGERTAPRPRGDNLPGELTRFIGREQALDDVGQLLRRGPLVTLTGPAGAGKTRLALEVAARERERHRDGVWLVTLGPVSEPEMIVHAIAGAVEVQVGDGSLVDALAGRDLLLLLDNCEHLIGACAELVEALTRSCPDLTVLATSREPLELTGELIWRVPPLPEAEAVRLFVDRAGAAQRSFALSDDNKADVAEICRRLDGLPLALELAAARVAMMPPAEIARRLESSFDLLRQRRRSGEARQHTLEAALDWSYRLLDEDEARMLARLAVFAGSFGLDAVEDVCGSVEVVLRLVSKSLVTPEGSRYRLLTIVRRYARERLAEAGEEDSLREQHARFYMRAAEAGTELDANEENVREALAWLLDHDAPAALRLASALTGWWLLRGRLAEGRRWLAAAVERAPDATAESATALLRAMPFAGRIGDLEEAARLAERSVGISRRLGDHGASARALHHLGLNAWIRGERIQARAWLGAAIDEARQASSRETEANALHGLALVAISTRELARARALLMETLERLEGAFVVCAPYPMPVAADGLHVVLEESPVAYGRSVDAAVAPAYLQANLAFVARLEGDLAAAGVLLERALAQLRAARDDAGVAQVLAAIGRLALLHDDTARARSALRESLDIRRQVGDVRSVAITLSLLGELAAREGNEARGRALAERALTLVFEVSDRPAVGWMQWTLAYAALAGGRFAEARTRLEAALVTSEALRARPGRAWALVGLADVEMRSGDTERARRLTTEARSEFEHCSDPWGGERCDALEHALSAAR
jgi:predicted ATPase